MSIKHYSDGAIVNAAPATEIMVAVDQTGRIFPVLPTSDETYQRAMCHKNFQCGEICLSTYRDGGFKIGVFIGEQWIREAFLLDRSMVEFYKPYTIAEFSAFAEGGIGNAQTAQHKVGPNRAF
jgi:hypothetical protein